MTLVQINSKARTKGDVDTFCSWLLVACRAIITILLSIHHAVKWITVSRFAFVNHRAPPRTSADARAREWKNECSNIISIIKLSFWVLIHPWKFMPFKQHFSSLYVYTEALTFALDSTDIALSLTFLPSFIIKDFFNYSQIDFISHDGVQKGFPFLSLRSIGSQNVLNGNFLVLILESVLTVQVPFQRERNCAGERATYGNYMDRLRPVQLVWFCVNMEQSLWFP